MLLVQLIGPENAMDICALKLLGDKSSVSLSTLESKGLGNWHLVYNLFSMREQPTRIFIHWCTSFML